MVTWGCVIALFLSYFNSASISLCTHIIRSIYHYYASVPLLLGPKNWFRWTQQSSLPQLRLWGFHHNTLPAIKVFTICDFSSNAKYLTALSRSGQVCFVFASKLNWNFYPQKFNPSKKSWPLKMLKHAKKNLILL